MRRGNGATVRNSRPQSTSTNLERLRVCQATRRENKAFTFPRCECLPPFTSDSPSHTPWEQGFYIPTARMLGTFHIKLAKSHAVGTRLLHSHGANACHLSHQTRQVTHRGNKAFTFPRRECLA
ncbi:hypothetical protein AVEN_25989-1, partial [Araneus ventricosus]